MVSKQKNFRKFIVAAATATMVATAIVPAALAADAPNVSERYQNAVDYLASNGLVDGTFDIHAQIKRVDAAILLAKAMGLENYGAPDSGFADVPAQAVKAVNVLKDLGIINGKTYTTFGSQDTLTRAEMAKIITLAYNLPVQGTAHPFNDVNALFTDYVQAVYQAGMTNGVGETTYGANQAVKLGEFAVFLSEAEQYEKVVQDVLVSNLSGVINEDNTLTITGEAIGVEKVTVVLPNGGDDLLLEAVVVEGKFSVTTTMPNFNIRGISILGETGEVLYEGVSDQVVTAAIAEFNLNPVNK